MAIRVIVDAMRHGETDQAGNLTITGGQQIQGALRQHRPNLEIPLCGIISSGVPRTNQSARAASNELDGEYQVDKRLSGGALFALLSQTGKAYRARHSDAEAHTKDRWAAFHPIYHWVGGIFLEAILDIAQTKARALLRLARPIWVLLLGHSNVIEYAFFPWMLREVRGLPFAGIARFHILVDDQGDASVEKIELLDPDRKRSRVALPTGWEGAVTEEPPRGESGRLAAWESLACE